MSTNRFEGYHDERNLPVKKGDTVTIVKGTTIRTTMPKVGGGYVTKTAGRTYKVKVDHVLPGRTLDKDAWQVTRHGETPGPRENPSVRWPGTGGYWFEVEINNIPEAGVV
jgi:hypothetical protein